MHMLTVSFRALQVCPDPVWNSPSGAHPCPSPAHLGETLDVDASASDGGTLSNPENNMFGMPVIIGRAGTALSWQAGMHAHILESPTGRSSPVSLSLLSSGAHATV